MPVSGGRLSFLARVNGLGAAWCTVLVLSGPEVRAASAAEPGAESHAASVSPSGRNACAANRYRQAGISAPLADTSNGGEGHPWRAMYGYCIAGQGKFTLHQDWVVSYLDARPQRESPGGAGVSAGTDFSLQWRHRQHGTWIPYYELGGGIQYAAGTAFPAHGSRWMFTINVGAGLAVPIRKNLRMMTGLRYLHISNGGMFPDNAGYDALHLMVALRWP